MDNLAVDGQHRIRDPSYVSHQADGFQAGHFETRWPLESLDFQLFEGWKLAYQVSGDYRAGLVSVLGSYYADVLELVQACQVCPGYLL